MSAALFFETTPAAEDPLEIVKTYVEATRQHSTPHYERLAKKGLDSPGGQMYAATLLELMTNGKEGEYHFVTCYADKTKKQMLGFSLTHRFVQANELAYVVNYLSYLKKANGKELPTDLGDRLLAETIAAIPPTAVKLLAIAPRDEMGLYAGLSGVKLSGNPQLNGDDKSRMFTSEQFRPSDTAKQGDMLCLLHLPRRLLPTLA